MLTMLLDISVKQTLLADSRFNLWKKLLLLATVMFMNGRVPTKTIANEIFMICRLDVWTPEIYAIEATEKCVVNYAHGTRCFRVWIRVPSL